VANGCGKDRSRPEWQNKVWVLEEPRVMFATDGSQLHFVEFLEAEPEIPAGCWEVLKKNKAQVVLGEMGVEPLSFDGVFDVVKQVKIGILRVDVKESLVQFELGPGELLSPKGCVVLAKILRKAKFAFDLSKVARLVEGNWLFDTYVSPNGDMLIVRGFGSGLELTGALMSTSQEIGQ